MAFENINVDSLNNALNACKNSINKSISENLSNSVMNNSVWYSDARNNLKKAIDVNLDMYRTLESKIDEYFGVVNKLREYKNLEEQNRVLMQEYQDLSRRLYYTETRRNWYWNNETQEMDWDEETVTVKDTRVEASMNGILSKVETNKSLMKNLENTIRNMV